MPCFSLKTFPTHNRTIFLRVDFNVPLEKGKVLDNTKIRATLPTIHFLLQHGCKVVLATHLGRPQEKHAAKYTEKSAASATLSVTPVAKELQRLLPHYKIKKLDDCIGKGVAAAVSKGKPGDIFFLENLRFYKEEEENDFTFAHALASLADVYVNDAFGVAHRKHASVHAITQFLPAVPGFLVEKEVALLSKALRPERPAVWIIGGAKLNKVELIEQALKKADKVLIGGALAFAFLRAKGILIGVSKVDHASIVQAKKLLKKRAAKKIVLPRDFIVAEKFSPHAKTQIVPHNSVGTAEIALDIGPETIKLFTHHLQNSRTIFWNGPLGYFEWSKFSRGTKEVGKAIGKVKATAICGGGETSEAVHKFHLEHHFTHVSTGGGAALAFLAGEKLPALRALEENYRRFRRKVGVL
ncbi:phosphoglycerate kinase [Candidatus Woesearchaeota archaeon]|nr:phosphoglycerate kinase [Candidatus Woesearchaeota archaeon]